MTIIEIDFLRAAISFFTRKKEIDWEQRRYEIAKDYFVKYSHSPLHQYDSKEEIAEHAVKYADTLIVELKKEKTK